MSDPDDLFTVRNCFWLGLYNQAIAEANGLRNLPEQLRIERDEFMFRSYIALGQSAVVLAEVRESAPTALQAVKLLATYEAQPDAKEIVLMTLAEWLDDQSSGNNPTLQLIAATIYCREDNLKDAIRAIRTGVTMEQIALLAQIYLRMDRLDLAQKQHRILQQADEDAALTHLVGAWVCISGGGAKKAQEAAYVYDELIDKYNASAMLLNGAAVAKMHLGEWQEAEASLIEASTKGGCGADTLINLIACSRHTDKPAATVQRYVDQLRMEHPNHPYVISLSNAESAFARVSDNLAVA